MLVNDKDHFLCLIMNGRVLEDDAIQKYLHYTLFRQSIFDFFHLVHKVPVTYKDCLKPLSGTVCDPSPTLY